LTETISVNGVTYYRQKPVSEDDKDLLEKYDWLKNEIGLMLKRSKDLYEQMKDGGLSIGMIEAEGSLRTAQEMQKWLEYIETWGD
jgi:hypothetical protein